MSEIPHKTPQPEWPNGADDVPATRPRGIIDLVLVVALAMLLAALALEHRPALTLAAPVIVTLMSGFALDRDQQRVITRQGHPAHGGKVLAAKSRGIL